MLIGRTIFDVTRIRRFYSFILIAIICKNIVLAVDANKRDN
jgi:hypothetical protein